MSPATLGTRTRRLRRPTPGGAQLRLKPRHVDRLMWRTGFGPTPEGRARLAGRNIYSVVDELLAAPQGALKGPAPTKEDDAGNPLPLAPTEDDTDLVLEWVDRMVRIENPLVERLTLFWHDHFGNSRAEVSPPQMIRTQIGLCRKYADLAANPAASFTDLLYEVGEDPSMLRFLNGENNQADSINENYGREVCELYALGTTDVRGVPNYTEQDVVEVSRAMTGWVIEDENPLAVKARFDPERWDSDAKTFLGQTGSYDHRKAVDVVLAHYSHARFILTKLWHEFVVTPPSPLTMSELIRTYKRNGRRLRPAIRSILTSREFLREIDGEPNMIKPPVVYVVGVMRALGLGITDGTADFTTDTLGQRPYFPPTVAGWDQGVDWLNTNTAQERFGYINRLYNDNLPLRDGLEVGDAAGESGAAALARAHKAVGQPYVSKKAWSALRYQAGRMKADKLDDRSARQKVLRTFLLGGPDAQVV